MDLCDPWKCPPTKYTWGSLDPSIVMQKLVQDGITQAKIQHTTNGFIITLVRYFILLFFVMLCIITNAFILYTFLQALENATITVEPNSTQIVCRNGDGSVRLKLKRILVSCLTEF